MKTKTFYCSAGKVDVSIGDRFDWKGVHPVVYEVVGWGELSGIYSPSGLGGTSTVFVRDEYNTVIEWCGDSVASGVHFHKIDTLIHA